MKKHLKAVIITGCVITVLTGGLVAFAASSNVSDLESAWLDFQSKLDQEMVKNGDITQEEADKTYDELEEQFEASNEDVVYQHFTADIGQVQIQSRNDRPSTADRGLPERSSMRPEAGENTIQQYAELTNQETRTIRQTLEDQNINIWQLAEQEGSFDALKAAMLEAIDDAIGSADSDSEIERLQQQRDDIAAMASADDYQGPENTGGFGRSPERPGGGMGGVPGGKNS